MKQKPIAFLRYLEETEAWRGKARLGLARRGWAWLGMEIITKRMKQITVTDGGEWSRIMSSVSSRKPRRLTDCGYHVVLQATQVTPRPACDISTASANGNAHGLCVEIITPVLSRTVERGFYTHGTIQHHCNSDLAFMHRCMGLVALEGAEE